MTAVRTIIFAKAPTPGSAKTRLIPALGAEGAAHMAKQMLDRTIASALDADLGPVELCITPEISSNEWHYVDLPDVLIITDQGIGDLGERMGNAAERTIPSGLPILLVGTDCAEMSANLLREAASGLIRQGTVIYPAMDGGYALLGLTRMSWSLFRKMAWSTDAVARETIDRIGRLGWPIHVGPTLHDIDEPGDMTFFPAGLIPVCRD